MRTKWWLCLTLATACGDSRYRAVEEWTNPPEVRVAALFSAGVSSARALTAGEPLQLDLGDGFERGSALEVWLFGYDLAGLAEAYPGLAGRSAAEVATLLSPRMVPEVPETVPPAREILTGIVSNDGPAEVVYTRRDFAAWTAEVEAGRKQALVFELPQAVLCGAIEATAIEVPATLDPQAIAAISPQAAIVAGRSTAGGTGVELARLDGDRFTALPARAERAPVRGPLSWDPTTNSGYGVDALGALFRFGPEGEVLPVTQYADGARGAWVGRDGTLMVEDYDLFILRNGAWSFLIENEMDRKPGELLRVLTRDQLAVLSVCWVTELIQNQSTLHFADLRCANEGIGRRDTNDIAIDADGVALAGNSGRVAIYDRRTKTRVEHAGALGRADMQVIAALGRGRYVAGGAGVLAVWLAPGWCTLPIDGDRSFIAASSSPTDHAAFLISEPRVPGAATVHRVRVP
jgi:hypothetical protein